jgi:CIC family chloride channel protein
MSVLSRRFVRATRKNGRKKRRLATFRSASYKNLGAALPFGEETRVHAPKRFPVIEQASRRVERLVGENVYMLVLAAIVGVLGGFGAILFRWLIERIADLAFAGDSTLAALRAAPWYLKLLAPAAGGLVVGPIIYFLAREARGHGLPEVMNTVTNLGGRMRRRVMLVKTVASAITLGTGGSAGREGPIVQIGAGIGSTVGQTLGFEGNRLIVLLGCGAAAGLAATFNAPIAGVMLAIEVIIGSASISVFSPIVVASVAGTVVSRMAFGNVPFVPAPAYALVNPAVELPLYVALGVAAGLTGLAFTKGITALEELWERAPIPAWLTPMLGGAVVGGIAVFFPHVLGVGYETISDALHGREAFGVLAALVVLKLVATGFTLGSGGSGGVFAPSLFIGACLGGAFGLGAERLLPGYTADSGAYALVGMGAVLAATTHAPVTAILMLFELSANFTIVLPLMLTCIIATGLAARVLPTSIFTTALARRGVRLRGSSEAEMVHATKIRRILRPYVETMPPTAPVSEVVRRALAGSMPNQFVVDSGNRPIGVIGLAHLKSIMGESGFDEAGLMAADVMRAPVVALKLDDSLDVAMGHFSRADVEALPVVGDDGAIAGCVTRYDLMVFFEHEVLHDQALGMKFQATGRPEEAQFVELPEGHVLALIEVSEVVAGKTLHELDLRRTAGINVVGIRVKKPEGIERLAPDPKRRLAVGEILVAVGPEKAIAAFRGAVGA